MEEEGKGERVQRSHSSFPTHLSVHAVPYVPLALWEKLRRPRHMSSLTGGFFQGACCTASVGACILRARECDRPVSVGSKLCGLRSAVSGGGCRETLCARDVRHKVPHQHSSTHGEQRKRTRRGRVLERCDCAI